MSEIQNKTHGHTGFKRIIFAAENSYKGLKWMLKNEAAFRQEAVLLLVLIVATFFFNISVLERMAMIVSLLVVMLVETINTSIEAVVDRIGLERHELSGLAKDLGSTAVFISMIITLVVWITILIF
jgi:diacylglycerol kinase (ATP)